MIRLNDIEINQIFRLIKEGKSLNKISRLLNKSKSTVYYHFRKFKGRTVNPISLKSNDEELIGEFIGLFAGDGYANKTIAFHYRIYLFFNITERKFVNDLVKNVLVKLFGKEPNIFRQKNALVLFYCSKEIHYLINNYLVWDKKYRKTYSIQLKNRDQSDEFIKGFLRGCLDSDGYLSPKKICFSTVSKELIEDISIFLTKLNISNKVTRYKEKRKNRKDIYNITLSRLDHYKFLKIINPRNVKENMRQPGLEFPDAEHLPDQRLGRPLS